MEEEKMIKVFTTPTCPYCLTLKEFLEEHKITFKDFDVSQDKKALKEMVKRSGQMGVPVIEIDGQVVVGFDREELSRLLKIKN